MKKRIVLAFFLSMIFSYFLFAEFSIKKIKKEDKLIFLGENEFYRVKIIFRNNRLEEEEIENLLTSSRIKLDGNFLLNVVFSDWRPPKTLNNSQNPVSYDKSLFTLSSFSIEEKGSKKFLNLELKSEELPFILNLNYLFLKEKSYYKKRIDVRKNNEKKWFRRQGAHFLRKIYPLYEKIESREIEILKSGGYGQPVSIGENNIFIFSGIEYPAGTNEIFNSGKNYVLSSFQYIGENIMEKPISSDWVVIGVGKRENIKYLFFRYLDDIRAGKLRPYLLYNSWYDLRAPEMVENKKNIMNEKNSYRIYNTLKEKLNKFHLKLDAFVLDDGWDIYKSDWKLSKEQFPHGLKPISDKLRKNKTVLGIWFGPTGGYSHREWRVSWMREHGYETVGDQMCFGGENYYKLFEKRIVDFIKEYRVGYYKWDGFQFVCNEDAHGHPVGVYSRRHILGNLIKLSKRVRSIEPSIFLNITSGTWLSPWWVMVADTIWMQGYDYSYLKVPSISKRDMAMTYRDYVLYEDFKKYNFWFPISNLMTHGIIKGDLQKLGGEKEPLSKFADNAVMYFARGISMYELYITPDLLTNEEWEVIGKSILWAKENFDILTHYTEMIGGDPSKGEPYGYVHFKGNRGIIALRNPSYEEKSIEFLLDHTVGYFGNSSSLILERVYPSGYIFPHLYKKKEKVNLNLKPYETAIFKIYPLEESEKVLITNVFFKEKYISPKKRVYLIYEIFREPKILNPEIVSSIKFKGKKIKSISKLVKDKKKNKNWIEKIGNFKYRFFLADKIFSPTFLILVLMDEKEKGKVLFDPKIYVDERPLKVETVEGDRWLWFLAKLDNREGVLKIKGISSGKFNGRVLLFFKYKIKKLPQVVFIELKKKIPSRKIPSSLPMDYNLEYFEKIDEFNF